MKLTFNEQLLGLLLITMIILGAKLVYAQIIYDDLRCAFTDCLLIGKTSHK